MRTIDVDLQFDQDNDEPSHFVSEDETMQWPYAACELLDWKDTEGQQKALASLEGDIVTLFDGSDTTIYASMNDMLSC